MVDSTALPAQLRRPTAIKWHDSREEEEKEEEEQHEQKERKQKQEQEEKDFADR